MAVLRLDPLQALLDACGFDAWSSRFQGERLRCPHGLLIGLRDECPVGCISPLVVMGLLEPLDLEAIAEG